MNANEHHSVVHLAKEAKKASFVLAQSDDATINNVLTFLAGLLDKNKRRIIDVNKQDCAAAKTKGCAPSILDRLALNEERLDGIAQSLINISNQDSPTDKTLWQKTRPNGLLIERISVPLGVLGMIYEARPNVTIDAAALALKSKNAIILRSGSDCLNTSIALHSYIQEALEKYGLPASCVQIIKTSDRAAVGEMLSCHEYIDVVIPRGGRSLIERITNEATMPVFSHLEGICHTFIDDVANLDMVTDVISNAKMRRTGVCGATETLLIHQNFPKNHCKVIFDALSNLGCEIIGDADTLKIYPNATAATENDWSTEYLAAKLSVKFIPNLDAAIEHINHYGSHHTDCILTDNLDNAARFQAAIDSGIVIHNASTQFADGGEFGMGAEIGISTGKFHARGPVGAEQLCTYKYIVRGTGQTRP